MVLSNIFLLLMAAALLFGLFISTKYPTGQETTFTRKWRDKDSWYLMCGSNVIGTCKNEEEEKIMIDAYESFKAKQ